MKIIKCMKRFAVLLMLIWLIDVVLRQKHGRNQVTRSSHRHVSNKNDKKNNQTQNSDVTLSLPWIMRRNFLPNFYTRKRKQSPDVSSSWCPDTHYQQGTIAFLHNQKSGGTTIKECMRQISSRFRVKQPSLIWNGNAASYYATMRLRGGFRNKKSSSEKFYFGGHTFRICDFTSHPCSYFTIMRDPLERVISSYEFCKIRYMEPQCQVRNASELSVNEWAVHQGSFFFRQLLYNPDFCSKLYDNMVSKLLKPGDSKKAALHTNCWYRNELVLSSALSSDENKYAVLDHVLDNLEKWFAVVGITEEMDMTLKLLEHAYKYPFYRMCSGKWKNYHQYDAEKERHLETDERNRSRGEVVDELKSRLWADSGVIKALKFDLMIYEKIKQIFLLQKEILFH